MLKVNEVKVTYFLYETEDEDKVYEAVSRTLLAGGFPYEITESKLEGHYRNKIVTVSVTIQYPYSELFVKFLLSSLDKEDRMLLLAQVDNLIERNKLYLRIDKQRLVKENRIALGEGGDVIRVVISGVAYSKGEMEKWLKQNVNL